MVKLSRKELIQLGVVVLFGWGASQVLQRTAPIGRNISANQTAIELLQDKTSPSRNVKSPTLTLVVFTDYQCGPCKLANPAMDAAVEKDGHVRVVYKDWPIFGLMSEQAARVAIASAAQGIYPALHTALMDERRRLEKPVLREAVEQVGGHWDLIEQELAKNGAAIDTQLALNRRSAFALGVAGTPAYLAGPILVSGALDEAEFRKLFALGRNE